ncbi:hypothetical protein SNL152K_10810 [Streptomyces sp. NL15-2K]|nr:hypothetical protein SNL152K_10810 [Streptomyces sp. NL15-2K]
MGTAYRTLRAAVGRRRGCGQTDSNAALTVRYPTPCSRIKARYDILAQAARRIAA